MINIEEILERYWEGESTLEEEKLLRTYFRSDTVSPDHLPYKDLFSFYDKASEKRYTGSLNVPDTINQTSHRTKILTITRRVISAAAVLTLLVASLFIIRNQISEKTGQEDYVYEISDPDEALEVTLQALTLVSGKLDKGASTMINGMQNVEKANILK
jgi:hypothetical protein